MKKLYSMLYISILMFFLIAGTVSAVEWDNTLKYSDQDLKIELKNWFGLTSYGSAVLKSHPSVNYIRQVRTGDRVVMWYDFNFTTPYEKGLGKVIFKNEKNSREIGKNYSFVYWGNKPYIEPIFECDNKTGICTKTGEKVKNKMEWLPYNLTDIPAQEIRIGVKVNVEKNEKVDVIWTIGGKRVDKHAVYSSGATTTYQKLDGTNYTILTYLNDGTFNTTKDINISLLMVGGGGGGGKASSCPVGGGGAGGYFFNNSHNLSSGNYNIVIGDGGGGALSGDNDGSSGQDTTFAGLTAMGGGGGGATSSKPGKDGGSGGGGGGCATSGSGGSGIQFSTYGYGNGNDGSGVNGGNGGGGAGSAGSGTTGGDGLYNSINGTNFTYAEGGGYSTGAGDGTDGTGDGGQGGGTAQDGGSGVVVIRYETSTLADINLLHPADNENFTTQNLYFTANVSNPEALTINNISLIIDGEINQTNTSGVDGIYNFSAIIPDGDYNYTINGYVGDDLKTSTNGTLDFKVDTLSPVFNIYSPINDVFTYALPYNSTLNVSTTDANLDTCWYYTSDNSTNVTYTCNSIENITFNDGGNKTVYIWANDTLGTENSSTTSFFINFLNTSFGYDTPVVEGNSHISNFNISATSISTISANISYNGTIYTMDLISNNGTFAQFNKSLTAPEVNTDTSLNLSVNYSINGIYNITSNNTQLIYNIQNLTVTSSDCSTKALTFDLVDEGNLTDLNGTFDYNFLYGIGANTSHTRVFGTISNEHSFNVCINETIGNTWTISEGQIFYTSNNYVDRRYHLFNGTELTNATNNITLYDLLSADQTSFKLEVEDTSLNPYVEKFTTLIRWYPDLNEYNVVDMGLTDEQGSTVIHVRTEDVDYRIGVYEQNGTLIKLADPLRMVCLVSPCTYTLKVIPTDQDYSSLLNIDGSLEYNYTTGIWTFAFSDPSQRTSLMNLTVYKLTGTSVYPVCTNSVTAYTGALNCNTSAYTGTLKGVVERSASPPAVLAEKIISIGTSAFSSSFGLWISLLIAIPIIFIFAFMTPLGAIMGGIISLIPAFYFGAINWAILGGIAVLGGIVFHFLRRT